MARSYIDFSSFFAMYVQLDGQIPTIIQLTLPHTFA